MLPHKPQYPKHKPVVITLENIVQIYSSAYFTMPKNKKKQESSSSSDSDDGPVDRNPPAEKKAKLASSNRTDDKEPTWVLQGKKLVKVREFKGKVYVDIREFYEKNGELLPGKKGISMTPEQWRKLLSLGDEINETVSSLC
ncbi:unnamed protein product [Arctia plantaginis]|uniref:Transcriptional coactivator p15 (PC4) C-terminal domain-containing protein n=1 Tax=Arctia plantaginis TaxID=874455 RepID=A0A8S1AR40_ARCPL|nr:unnamed protein product [Arctia plantaginis]